MKKSIRSVVCMLFAVVLSLAFGCANTAPRTISGNIEIPKNGIIEKSVFEQLKAENSIAVFCGESNGIKYEWTVFGSDISDPKQLDMALSFDENRDGEAIAFTLSSAENFGFKPTLSIYLNEVWKAQSASVFSDNDGNMTPVCSASITGKESSILNFSLAETCGKYVVTADTEEYSGIGETVYSKDEITAENKNNEKSDYLSDMPQADEKPVYGSDNEASDDPAADSQISSDISLSPKDESGRVYSDGSVTNQDLYRTDPIPEGRPMPVEPDDAEINESNILTCTFSIECTTILNNISQLEPEKLDVLTSDGIVFAEQTVEFKEGESVFDVLQRVCKENKIHMEASVTPVYNSAYVEGINNLYEFDCGALSGWIYRVNGWYPNYGCSRYQLADGDVVEWRFTCDSGKDVGCGLLSGK